MVTPGVLPDLQSGIKKCPNLFRLCGFAIRSKGVCFTLCWGIVNPRFNRSNLFFTADFKSAGTPGGFTLLKTPRYFGVAIIPRASLWARGFCPLRACCFYPFSSNSFCNRMISSRYCAACMKSRSLAACFIRAVVLAMLFSNSSLLMLRTIGSATIVVLSGSM